ncbi:MAG: hypothetical protein ACO3JG_13660 [Luteolibacter sp.]
MKCQLAVLAITLLSAFSAFAVEAVEEKPGNGPDIYPENSKQSPLAPTHADVRYGSHDRNKLDFLQAGSEAPTPVVVIIHGANFGVGLQQRCADAEVDCQVVFPGAPDVKYTSPVAYLVAKFKAPN